MSLEKNEAIEIRQLANGFAVYPAFRGNAAVADESRYVFQSMHGLINFLRTHFDHREEFIQGDLVRNFEQQTKRP